MDDAVDSKISHIVDGHFDIMYTLDLGQLHAHAAATGPPEHAQIVILAG